MRKIMTVFLFASQGMYGMLSLDGRVPLRMPQAVQQRHAFNTHAQFGKTHFIVGYGHNQQGINSAKSMLQKDDAQPRGKKRKRSKSNSANLLDENRNVQSFFTSRHNVRSVIATLLEQAEKSILIAVFILTDPDICRALKKAHAAGIKVEVITDYSSMNKPYSKIQDLVNSDVPVFYYNHALNQDSAKKNERFIPLMHLKLIVCDEKIVVTGSSNLTKAGQKGNVETITIIRDKKSVDEHIKEFDHLRPLCTPCQFFVKL